MAKVRPAGRMSPFNLFLPAVKNNLGLSQKSLATKAMRLEKNFGLSTFPVKWSKIPKIIPEFSTSYQK